MRKIKLAWLAGIIEGEGSFCLNKSSGKRKHFVFRISITNTDLMILNECKNVLAENNIACTLYQRKVYYKHRKVGYNLTIYGLENLIKMIEVLMPYLVGQKKSQAQIMLDFLKRRKSLVDSNKGFSARRIKYDEIDYAYFESLEALKNISESVETCALSIPKKSVKKCKIAECSNKHYSKGYCQKHYDKFIHYPRYRFRKDEDTVRATHINKSVDSSRNDLNAYLN